MNIRIEVDKKYIQNEIIIQCSEINDDIIKIQSLLSDLSMKKEPIIFYKKEQEYYLELKDILFFETDASGLTAHTAQEVYYVKYRLYELEKVLPKEFSRISKSTIVNVSKIYSILRNITSASKIEFQNTHKKIYVSRNYYKNLKLKLLEKRN